MEDQLEEVCYASGLQYFLHRGSWYGRRAYSETPFGSSNLSSGQSEANRSASVVRVTVEWVYREVKFKLTVADFNLKIRAGQIPLGSIYIGELLLQNVCNCLYLNTVSQYFTCTLPSFKDYLAQRYWLIYYTIGRRDPGWNTSVGGFRELHGNPGDIFEVNPISIFSRP